MIQERCVEERRHGNGSGGKTVQTVRQINGIRCADEDEYDKYIVKRADLPHFTQNRHPYTCIMSKQHTPDQNRDKGDEELTEQLLIGAQAEVALFDHFDVVIRKAEQKMPEEDEEHEQRRHRKRCKEQRRRGHGEDDHHAAHRRCPALLLMAGGALLANALPIFQTVQHRQKVDAAEQNNGESCHKGQQNAQLWR